MVGGREAVRTGSVNISQMRVIHFLGFYNQTESSMLKGMKETWGSVKREASQWQKTVSADKLMSGYPEKKRAYKKSHEAKNSPKVKWGKKKKINP